MFAARAASFRRHLGAAVLGVAVCAVCQPAAAQVVALVNGEPITQFDIAQRMRLEQISTHKVSPRNVVLQSLIDDKLKLTIAKRYRLDIPKTQIDGAFANMAQRSGLSPEQFIKALAGAGISADTIKERIRVDIGWNEIIRGKFAADLQVGERDVRNALKQKGDVKEETSYDYTLRPVLLIVPRGSAPAVFAARQREAESLRTRFDNCRQGLVLARGMRDTAVRGAIYQNSSDLSPQLRELLDKTPLGHLTPPEVTAQGIEFFAVCGKKPSGTDSIAKRQVRDEIARKRFEDESKRYLEELRRGAMIEYR